jgi:hypothetical protein
VFGVLLTCSDTYGPPFTLPNHQVRGWIHVGRAIAGSTLNSEIVHVGLVVAKVAMVQVSVRVLQFYSIDYHSSISPY